MNTNLSIAAEISKCEQHMKFISTQSIHQNFLEDMDISDHQLVQHAHRAIIYILNADNKNEHLEGRKKRAEMKKRKQKGHYHRRKIIS